jgi:hypothetical protein
VRWVDCSGCGGEMARGLLFVVFWYLLIYGMEMGKCC